MAQTQIPIAAGKAAALQSFLARRDLPKGRRLERVKLEFERKWEKASPAIKDKYARRDTAGAALAPSEKKRMGKNFNPNASMTEAGEERAGRFAPNLGREPVNPRASSGAGYGRSTKREGGDDNRGIQTQQIVYDVDGNPMDSRGNPVAGPNAKDVRGRRSSDANNGGKPISAGFAPGSDEARAAALTESSRDERYATADTGGGGMASAVAMEQGRPAGGYPEGAKGRGGVSPVAQNSRAQTGASPSAPAAAKAEAAKIAPKPIQTPPPATQSPTSAAPIAPSVSALRPAPDFTPGPGKELTGMSGGRPTYTSADSLYGAAKTTNVTEKRQSPNEPVMTRYDVQTESMEQRRADYQNRNQTPMMRDGADNAMRAQGLVPTPAPRTPVVAPKPVERQIGNTGSRSLQETSRMADADKTARESGKMGDYFTSQGKAEMAKAFPNRTEDPKDLKLGQRKPLTTLASTPLRAIPVKSRA